MPRAASILTFVTVAIAADVAIAQEDQEEASAMERGLQLYEELEYEQAIEPLEEALEEPDQAPEGEVLQAFQALALSYLALGEEEKAQRAFERLLRFKRDFELPETVSEKAMELFSRAREQVPKELPPVELRHQIEPATPKQGSPVDLEVRIASDPADRHRRVVVYHRVRGGDTYSTVWAEETGGGSYAATISGTFVRAPGLEYYVAAVDESGEPVGVLGSAAEPLALVIEGAPRDEEGGPIYTRWWFWTGVGGAVAAGVVTGFLLTSGGGGGDATVTITVRPPPDA